MSDNKPLGLAMIGMRHQHPRWYQPLWGRLPQYKQLAICDRDERFLSSENKTLNLDAYTNYRRALDREDIDVVIVWLPHSEMPLAVEHAASAGKHVIVEKPCCANLAGAKYIVDVSRRFPHIKISSPYCWRAHPASAHIRDAIGQGLLGDLLALEARMNAGGAWRYVRDNAEWMLRSEEGGGPMWNLGVHWIDYLRWITGQEVVSVSGQVNGPTGGPRRNIEDNAQALLRFDSGTIAMLDISYGLTDNYPGNRDIHLSIRGSKGSIQWAPAWESLTDEILIVSESPQARGQTPRRVRVNRRNVPGYGGEMTLNWLTDFATAVNEDRSPMVEPGSIYAAVGVADAFYRSVASGKTEGVATS